MLNNFPPASNWFYTNQTSSEKPYVILPQGPEGFRPVTYVLNNVGAVLPETNSINYSGNVVPRCTTYPPSFLGARYGV